MRQSLRLRAYDYAQAGAYFVTLCASSRACVFGEIADDQVRLRPYGQIVHEAWSAIPSHWRDVELDAFVVMPNHLHGIVVLSRAGQAPPLPTLIGAFKAGVTRRTGRAIWQRSFYDRVIRNDQELEAIRRYIAENPLKWAVDRENPAVRPV